MCKLCDNIYPDKDFNKIIFNIGKYEHADSGEFITKNEEGEYDLNVNSGDPYEVGIMSDVKFCPYCGKKLEIEDLLHNMDKENRDE